MTLLHLINQLLHLFAANPHVHRLLLHWYRTQQPGMPRGWYADYIRYLIHAYPHAMHACVRGLQHHASARVLLNTCP